MTCSPSEPGCEYEGACDGLFEPARSCINLCVEQWDPAADPAVMPNVCAVDPCDEETFVEEGAFVCPRGYLCVPDGDPRRGRCTPAGAAALETCRGFGDCVGMFCRTVDVPCEGGTFCGDLTCERAVEAVNALSLSYDHPSVTTTHICLLPVREGESCDSNMSDAVLGCAPCEAGTYCLDGDAVGLGFDGQRCVRRCEDSAGQADPSLCACGVSSCETVPEVVDPDTGERIGASFCETCIAANAGLCASTDECCPDTECVEVVLNPVTDQTGNVCCAPESASCSLGHDGRDPCCPGTRCGAGGTCETCGRDGDDATSLACCEGYVAIRSLVGQLECQPCGGFDCSPHYLTVRDAGGADPFPVPDTDVDYWRVAGGIGGDLDASWASADEAEYLLSEAEHRPYVFNGLMGGAKVGPGESFVQLPQTVTGIELAALPTPPFGWQSARVYDIGECSYLARWNVLVNLLGLEINQELSDIPYADPLEPQMSAFTITPELQMTPRLWSMPRGIQQEHDTVRLSATYQSDSIAGCVNQTLSATATARIVDSPVYIENDATAAADQAILANVSCQDLGASIRCTEIDFIDPDTGAVTFRTIDHEQRGPVTWYPRMITNLEENVAHAAEHHCRPSGDQYICTYYLIVNYTPSATYGWTWTVRYPRPMLELTHERDWRLELVDMEVDLIDPCIGDWFIQGPLRSRVEDALVEFDERFDRLLGQAWGDSLIDDFGVPPHLVPTCGTLPSGQPDHWQCRRSELFGGRRHECVNRAGSWVCDGARLEVRRMHVRPEGLEMVLSEGHNDPQGTLLAGKPGLVQPGTPLASLLGAPDPDLCDPARTRNSTGTTTVTPMPSSVSTSSVLFSSSNPPVCSMSDPSCLDICPQYGTTCNLARLANLPALYGRPPITGPRCLMGVCM